MANDISQASLNLSAEEKRVYGQLFQQADTEGVGVVTGDVAVKFFEKTRLEPSVLGEIWQIGDKDNRGFLTPAGFSIVLRLIGHCQNGRSPSSDLAMQSGPVPRFDGGAPTAQPTAAPLTQQQSGNAPIRVPPLTPDKVVDYSALFEKAGGRNGVLPGEGAKLVFERSRLPNDVLGQIWNLSDKDAKGTLNTTEFIIAMHLMASMRNGSMRAVPQTLPAGLYEAAQRRGPAPAAMGSVARQVTGQGPQRTQSPLSQSFGSPSMSAQTTGNDWLVTPAEKTGYDRAFASIDTKGVGYITGDQAVPFFSNSGLGEEALASIWDLADIKSEGQLTRDEFAVAMYLIRQARGGAPLPSSLPPGLIPPSMRQRAVPPAVSTAPNFENPAPAAPQQKSAADDLFGLDAISTEPAAAPKSDPFASDTPASPTSPKAAALPQPPRGPAGTSFGPAFVPSSRFGQDLAAQNTGGSAQSEQSRSVVAPPKGGADDLLGDTDPEISKKFTSETTDLANMSNQVGTLHKQMQEVQGKRSASERDLATNSSQKKELEARLARFRTQYEEEVRAVKSLESRLTTSRAETNKLSQDLAMLEGTHADLKTQHEQLRTAFETDQRENAELKEKIRVLNGQVAELRPVLEKLRNDARQQKGMAAINKKQLSTSEGEREKLETEKADLEKSISEKAAQPSTQPAAETSRDASSFGAASPAASITSQNTNPFFRKSPQQSTDAFMSPSTFHPEAGNATGQSNFDSFFAPSREVSSRAGPAPSTSFGGAATAAVAADATAEASAKTTSTPPPPTSAASGLQTPPGERNVSFETPVASIPPPPPQSRQITSSSLPLRSLDVPSDSPTSSVKANPPASRSGFSDFAGPTATAPGDTSEEASAPKANTTNEQPSAIPGAFPGEAESPVKPQPPATTDEYFKSTSGGVASHDASSSKADFDSAFASAGSSVSKGANGPHDTAVAGGEFPPIQDLEQEESDSEDEGGFAANSAPSAGKSAKAEAGHASDSAEREPMPPALESQTSPPAYEHSGGKSNANGGEQFPKEYSGLLPPRESSQGSPEPPHPSILAAAGAGGASSPPDSHSFPVSAELRGPAATKASTKAPADEFDSAFDDLDEAKEADEQGQEGFGFGSASRARDQDEEFDPSFDSPVPSKTNTMNDSVQHTPTTSTGRAFEQHTGSTFSSSTSPFSAMGTGQTQASTAATADSGHDWDAIFAGLDKPVADSSLNGNSQVTPAAAQSQQTQSSGSGGLAAPVGNTKGRPTGPARAISTGTEHDDPILKTLTGMGYPRDKALLALEKYDYNLDRAADYLTSGK